MDNENKKYTALSHANVIVKGIFRKYLKGKLQSSHNLMLLLKYLGIIFLFNLFLQVF